MCFSYFLIQTGFMTLHFGILTSLFGMFTANLVMYYQALSIKIKQVSDA